MASDRIKVSFAAHELIKDVELMKYNVDTASFKHEPFSKGRSRVWFEDWSDAARFVTEVVARDACPIKIAFRRTFCTGENVITNEDIHRFNIVGTRIKRDDPTSTLTMATIALRFDEVSSAEKFLADRR